MSREIWLEYKLNRLEFFNGAVLGFRKCRMLYGQDSHVIALEHLDTPGPQIDELLSEVANEDGSMPPIKTIFYEMDVEGYRTPFRFYHPLKRGANVRLLPREPGRSRLFFTQDDGRPMFTKDYTLRDVTRGQIDSNRAVWQFHGYKHEH